MLSDKNTSDEVISMRDQIKKGKVSAVLEVIRFIAIAAILVVIVRQYVIQPFIVNGDSMVPTFLSGQYLIIDELTYNFRSPDRGEVIVFRYPNDPEQFFIKRIIGLPGETVIIRNDSVTIKENNNDQGVILEEEYVKGRTTRNVVTVLGDNEYFVMGDNREASSDSRIWGPITDKHIVGRALVRLLPINSVDLLPGDHSNEFNN